MNENKHELNFSSAGDIAEAFAFSDEEMLLEQAIKNYTNMKIAEVLNGVVRLRTYARKWDTEKSEIEGFDRAMDEVEDFIRSKINHSVQ